MRKPRSGERPDSRRAALVRLAALGLAVAAAIAIVLLVVRPTPSAMRERVGDVRDWVDSAGVLAPLAFLVVSASLTPLMFPGPLLAGASGLLFGTWLGFPVTLAAATAGSAIAFSISRWAGGDAVERVAGRRLLAAHALVGRRGFASILYARIAPGIPYSLVNCAAGLTRIPLAVFAAATALGTAPPRSRGGTRAPSRRPRGRRARTRARR